MKHLGAERGLGGGMESLLFDDEREAQTTRTENVRKTTESIIVKWKEIIARSKGAKGCEAQLQFK